MSDTYRKTYSPLNEEQKKRSFDIKSAADVLEALFDDAWNEGYDSRMIKIAKTNLEQSIMWAVKAVTGPIIAKPVKNNYGK